MSIPEQFYLPLQGVRMVIQPFTIEALATRWDCSEAHIRNLIAKNRLRFFRVGAKLIRIPYEEIVRYETECLSQNSENTVDSTSSSPSKTVNGYGVRLARAMKQKQSVG